jgi:hypothetical protein
MFDEHCKKQFMTTQSSISDFSSIFITSINEHKKQARYCRIAFGTPLYMQARHSASHMNTKTESVWMCFYSYVTAVAMRSLFIRE